MYECEKLAMAECSIDLIHNILLNNIILVSRPMFTDWLIREAVEISLHICNMNRVPSRQVLKTPHLLPEEKKLVTSS
jgi:hypothetical protein